jgi:hypothetical protein
MSSCMSVKPALFLPGSTGGRLRQGQDDICGQGAPR